MLCVDASKNTTPIWSENRATSCLLVSCFYPGSEIVEWAAALHVCRSSYDGFLKNRDHMDFDNIKSCECIDFEIEIV